MSFLRALVTGGGGFLGSWVVRTLRARGVPVRALLLPDEASDNLDGLDGVEVVRGDVRTVTDVRSAVEGVDTVFHAAAIYEDWVQDPTLMYDVNLRGTFNVLEAARRAGVARIVVTASIVALGRPSPGGWADEETPYEAWDLDFPYSRSKYFSRELAEYFAAWGDDVRIVCPGIVLGPGDRRPTPSGQLILGAFRGLPALYTRGGASYVDVRDAAEVHVRAAESGRAGRRYIAAAHNLSHREFVEAIERTSGRRRPLIPLPVALGRAAANGFELVARRTSTRPLLSRVFLDYSVRPSFYRNRRAVDELGTHFRPFDETLRDAIAYFRRAGILKT